MTPSAALLVALLSQSPAAAPPTANAAPPARLRLDVRAPDACTSAADLAARIRARTARIDLDDSAALSAQVVVSAAPPGKLMAELTLGGEPPRRVIAASCGDVADGLALIIAVSLDPSLPRSASGAAAAEGSAAPSATRRPGPRARATAPGTSAPPAGVGARPAPAAPPASAAPEISPPPKLSSVPVSTESAPPGRASARRELGVSVAGQLVSGPAPVVMPGVAVYVTATLEREGAWAPAVMLGAMHVWRTDLSETGGTASFKLDAGSLDACPLRLRWMGLTARPCAATLVGRLAAEGSHTASASSSARPFVAAGAAVTASLGSTVELSARVGLGVTLVRDAYEFATDVFHRADLLVVSASLGVGTHWR